MANSTARWRAARGGALPSASVLGDPVLLLHPVSITLRMRRSPASASARLPSCSILGASSSPGVRDDPASRAFLGSPKAHLLR
ncbi:MAG: hypothetical protein R3F11_26265 [Verrucomicrobiales bacterium]